MVMTTVAKASPVTCNDIQTMYQDSQCCGKPNDPVQCTHTLSIDSPELSLSEGGVLTLDLGTTIAATAANTAAVADNSVAITANTAKVGISTTEKNAITANSAATADNSVAITANTAAVADNSVAITANSDALNDGGFDSVATGTCASHGYGVITTAAECETAGAALGWSDTTAFTYSWSGYPTGCYYYNGIDLNFNTDNTDVDCSTSKRCACKKPGLVAAVLGGFEVVTSGTCNHPITTKEECDAAASSLGLSDINGGGVDDVAAIYTTFWPAGCLIYGENRYYNIIGSTHIDCSSSKTCVCKIPGLVSAIVYEDSGHLRLNTDGNVIIGTSFLPGAKLEVSGDTRIGYIEQQQDGLWLSNSHTSGTYGNSPFIQGVDKGFSPKNIALNPSGGNVGIGNNSPSYKLDVAGKMRVTGGMSITGSYEGSQAAGAGKLFIYGGVDSYGYSSSGVGWYDLAVKTWMHEAAGLSVSNAVVAKNFMSHSDKRIKKDITDADTSALLGKLNQLRMRNYGYITKGGTTVGWIAQEVAEVDEAFVSTQTLAVPDIQKVVKVTVENGQTTVDLTGEDIEVGQILEIELRGGSELVNVTGVADGLVTFDYETVEGDFKYLKDPDTGEEGTDGLIHIYGRVVDDFHVLDKNRLLATSVGAIQELTTRLTTAVGAIQELTTRLAALEARLAAPEV